jgi:hypothetical protein
MELVTRERALKEQLCAECLLFALVLGVVKTITTGASGSVGDEWYLLQWRWNRCGMTTIAILVSSIVTVTIRSGFWADRLLDWMFFFATWAPYITIFTMSGESCIQLFMSFPVSPIFEPLSFWNHIGLLFILPVFSRCCIPCGRLSACFKGNAAVRLLLVICQMVYPDKMSLLVLDSQEHRNAAVQHVALHFAILTFLYLRYDYILADPSALWILKSTSAVGAGVVPDTLPEVLGSPDSASSSADATMGSADSSATLVPLYIIPEPMPMN